ncbi:MAG: OmcA/MtrC family decaheme c-type cytochrome [Georgfuchsia sp.]
MDNNQTSYIQWRKLVAATLFALALAGCGGGGSGGGGGTSGTPAQPPGSSSADVAALTAATALDINITGVSINSPPVVDFTVTNQSGVGMAGLTAANLRFNIAKLVSGSGSGGSPGNWQNYINRVSGGAVQGSQERSTTGYAFGTLTNHGNGTYTYTFATDITNVACPSPCQDADGKTLDLSYQPGLTHRVSIQQSNSAYPRAAGIYDFVPNGDAVTSQRDIVSNAKCNVCHSQLSAHGTRVDTKLCVTCHNPGSWVAGDPNTTVDFKVMIHKIHYNNNGAALPSVVAGTPYVVNGADFSKTTFPQDVRNCTQCHDGTSGASNATAQGDNWKTQPSMEACGACHDDVYFGTSPDPAKPYQTKQHPGGAVADNSTCAICHAAGRYTDNKDIVLAHDFPTRLAAAMAKFQYNIISATPTAAGGTPVITFSVTDPTNGNKPYDLAADAPFTATASGASRLAISIGWSTSDIGNVDSGADFGQPVSINILGNAAVVPGTAGTYTVTSPVAVPAAQTGTLRVTMDGHPAGDVTTPGTFTDRLAVKSVFKDFAITGTVAARRVVVDVAKCKACHGTLSLHGNNRTDEPGVCVVCHNPNATDGAQRIAAGAAGEESIDFKRMIHAIHAGGFRTTGFTVYGYGGNAADFSEVVFPGNLNDCTSCHTGDTYRLMETWAAPTTNGILGSTISSGASASDPADNLRITPTAAVCSSCHDSDATRQHMEQAFQGGNFSATQADISAANSEQCAYCHGPDGPWTVKNVHGIK